MTELFAWTALVAFTLAPLNLYARDDWLRAVSQAASSGGLVGASFIVAVALLAFYLTAEPCHLAFRLVGISLLAIAVAITAAYRLNVIDLNTPVIGIYAFENVAMMCEPLLFLAVGSAYVALPTAMRRKFT